MRKSVLCILFIVVLIAACGKDSSSSQGKGEVNPSEVVKTGDVECGATYACINGYVNLNAINIGGNSLEYGAQISKNENFSGSSSRTTKQIESNKFVVSFSTTSNTTYYYRAYLKTGGNTYYGQTNTFTTKELLNVTTTGDISNIALTSVVATCNVDVTLLDNKENYKYGIAYSLSKDIWNSDYSLEITPNGYPKENELSYVLKGLQSGSTYYYCSFSSDGEFYKSGEIKSFNTISNENYLYLKTTDALDISGNQATLQGWSDLENLYQDESVVYYFIYNEDRDIISNKNNYESVKKVVASNNNRIVSTYVSSLSFNTTYYYRIIAVVDNEVVAEGEILSFTTNSDYSPEGYSLVWKDEFDNGSELNAADWTHEVQSDHWVNNELQNYVNHKTPKGNLVTEISDGSLRIHCFKEDGKVYSGRVYAHVNEGWLYGYFEASIKLPKGKGTWPAFWMMPVGNDWSTNPWPKCGEIDIMEEVGVVPNEVSSSIHTQDYNHTKNTQKTHAMTISKAEGEFHKYALLWTADEIITYVDDKEQLRVSKAKLGSGHDQWPFHYAFYPIFNLAWGGDWGGMSGVDESVLPVTMEIDYIRVYQKRQ